MGQRGTKLGQIVSVTFPRSASRFARSVFETFYGPDVYVEGLCKMRLLKEKNAFTIIRKPEQAIPSWVSAVENYFEGFAGFTVENVVDESINLYIEWMEKTLENMSSIFISKFEDFTEDTQNELNKISKHFDLPLVKYDKSMVMVDYKHIPGGNPETELSKTVIYHSNFYKTIDAYNNVIKELDKKCMTL